MKKRILKILAIVFYLILAISIVGQVAQFIKEGPSKQTLVLFSEIIIFALFLLVYKTKEKISESLKGFKSLPLKFILIGYTATVIAETAYIFSKPLHQNLLIDLILVAPWYLLWVILWYFVLKKYDFSTKEAFFLGGFHGFVIEGLIAGSLIFNPLFALFALPLLSTIYGLFFIIPYLITKEEFKNQKKVSLRKKILVSLIPLLAYIPGAIWILALTLGFDLTLH